MKFDTQHYDAAIGIATIRHPGKFAIEVSTDGGKRSIRTAACVDAHSHVIQTTALLTGLALLKSKKISHPRLLVTSDEAPSLRMLRENKSDRLIIPAAMSDRLKSELREVNATFIHNAEPRFLISLENWLFNFPLHVLADLQGMIQQTA